MKKKNVQCDVDGYEYEKRYKDVSPCVHKSIKEYVPMFYVWYRPNDWSAGTWLAALSLPQGLSLPVVAYIIKLFLPFPFA